MTGEQLAEIFFNAFEASRTREICRAKWCEMELIHKNYIAGIRAVQDALEKEAPDKEMPNPLPTATLRS